MKPISVRFACFGPYMAEQFIDFTLLEESGLFLICGETGAGKTTILDAICYALYGRSSGALRGDLEVMRCKLADKEETFTEFIFESGGKRYKFVRSLKFGRKRLSDFHNCLVWEEGAWVPVFENPKATVVNKKAEELIGLTYDQFRQVIILPQGQFERLLVSNSEEKEKILVSLFHADRWQRIAEELYRRVAQRDEALKEEKRRMLAVLQGYRCESLTRLEELAEEKQQALEALRIQEAAAQKDLTAKRAEQEQALLENREFGQLQQLQAEQLRLESRRDYFEKEGALLSRADSAEAIRPLYQTRQEAAARRLRAGELASKRQAQRQLAEQKLSVTEEKMEAHEAGRMQQEERIKQVMLLENAREVYKTLAEKQLLAWRSAKKLEEAETAEKKTENSLKKAEEALLQSSSRQEKAIQAYQQAYRTYLLGIGGELAQSLTAGQPCPVCGSREHPAPAALAENAVTEQEVEILAQSMENANKAVSTALEGRTKQADAHRMAQSQTHQARQEYALARSAYENALSQTIPGIESAAGLEAAIQELRSRITAFRRQDALLTEALQEAKANLAAASAAETAAAEEAAASEAQWALAQNAWLDGLARAEFAGEGEFLECDLKSEERTKRMTALLSYKAEVQQNGARLAEKQQALEGKAAPNLKALRQALSECEQAAQTVSGKLILLENECKRMEKDRKDLQKRQKSYEAARNRTDADLDFAKRLRGDKGVSLQRYVLGVMLTAITLQANRLLEGVYGGRYRLYRTDEVAGRSHKSGLELEVLDNHTGTRRSVTTLSGGEKFLVALSLAIGLSTVVQAQGSGLRLEAMFIDEGFGSLDREAVHDALDVLQGIGGKAGLVGIISHVEALAEAIPAKIQIQKGRNGSHCVIRA